MASRDSLVTLWLLDAEGGALRQTGLQGVLGFDWYRDAQRIVYIKKTRGAGSGELRVAHLETGEDRLLLAGLWAEPVVTPSGDAIAYLHAASHYNMNVFKLPLTPPSKPDGLPVVAGQPEQLTDGKGVWHVHNLSWFPDGKQFVYTRDSDFGDIFVLENDVGKNGK